MVTIWPSPGNSLTTSFSFFSSRSPRDSTARTSLPIDQSVTTSADVCAVPSPALQDDGEPTYWNSNGEFNPMPTDPSPASDAVLGANDYVGNSDEANIDAEFSVPEESGTIDSSGFVQYYLDKLCPLHSLIQGPEDPFRMFVLDYLQDSSLIRDCIPWYDPKDLGIPHLQAARRLCEEFLNTLRNDLNESPVDTMSDREKSFLIGSMAYWEAAAAFTIDQPLSSINYLLPFLVEPDVINLNPLTGVCTPVCINLARVAVCARQQRMMAKIHPLGWDQGAVHAVSQDILTVARTSMTFVLNYHASCPTVTQDLGDSTRRLLQLISEIYNLACLVEVYRSFPCLMGSDDDPGTISSPATSSGGGSSGSRNQCQSGSQLQSAGYLIEDLALTMLDLLQELPERHNSTLWQTIPLVISGSVLHISAKPLHYTRTDDCDLSRSTPSLLRKLQSDVTEVDNAAATNIVRALPRFFNEEWIDPAECRMETVWSGIMANTADSLPFVGRLPHSATGRMGTGEWISAGYNSYGMTNGLLCGTAVAEMALGNDVSAWFPEVYLVNEERLRGPMFQKENMTEEYLKRST
ncbi:hypothetical protein CDV36_010028 [Fusarium kuroshium]|uniref:FAD dependent oxidoreductase domain-containing protein n=1 Tax=Fusarium kuroshium TaxID=2010991 RepID=A0A3M2RYI0_9HYPO|nr:hypothetical protein CDV36_010028 [Fusarium kuroshium]